MSITCKICNKEFKSLITSTHLRKHSISCEEYKKIYGLNSITDPALKQKRLSTMLEKYGAFVSPKTREKARERSPNLNSKGRETILERYGVSNPGMIDDHAIKIKQTYIEKFGVDHYSKVESYIEKKEKERFEKLSKFSPNSIIIAGIDDDISKHDIFQKPNKICSFTCLTCNTSDSLPTETYKWRIRETGTPCVKCSGINKGSVKEQKIKDFLIDNGICILENKKILGDLEIDIFIPAYNLGIEFNGLFWHNDTRLHKNYHLNKSNIAINKGIRLIHIFEDEWDHHPDIVKSRLLNILGKTNNRIYARLCQIREISFTEEKEFLEYNHIQGYAKSSIKLGLYHKDVLVSVMTFSKLNLSRGVRNKNMWELLRFASLLNYNIVGGASKLFSYFVKKYNPPEVWSYSDNRWNTGNTYKNIGFDYIGNTSIGYWYIDLKEGKRIHRFGMRKNSNDDENLSEYENRLNQGYLRIWDCGHSKWIWKNLNNIND